MRGASNGLSMLQRFFCPIFLRSSEGGCVAPAQLISVCVFNGKIKAKSFSKRMGDDVELGFSNAGNMVMKWVGRVAILKVKMGYGDTLEWLEMRKSGVYIVRLVQYQVSDHYVFVCESFGVLTERSKRYYLGLSSASLRKFGGLTANDFSVWEVCEAARQNKYVNRKEMKCRKFLVEWLYSTLELCSVSSLFVQSTVLVY